MNIRLKLALGSMTLAACVGYLAVSGVRSGWVYFVDVDAFVASGGRDGQRTRIHGNVGNEAFEVRRADLTASFNLIGKEKSLPVVYTGPIPDMFDAGRQVVVEGRLDCTGLFHADVLMTKCASKYEGHGENGPAHPAGRLASSSTTETRP